MADSRPDGRLTSHEAIALVAEVFEEHRPPPRTSAPDGPLGWSGYDAARARAAERTGAEESVRYGTAVVGGHRCVLLVFEFGFLGGSLGQRAGDRLEAAYELAGRTGVPLVSLVATGGSRMQEGMLALGQLQRVARAAAVLRAARVPHLTVLRDPATGGGWATVGAGADVVLALAGAQVGFAGSRVRPPEADPSAYTAEGQWAAGQVDEVVAPGRLRGTLARWLGALHRDSAGPPEPAPVPKRLSAAEPPVSGWDAVRAARDPARPRAEAYLARYFTHRLPLSGDRCGGVDPGISCGVGVRADGRAVAYAAQCGTATTPAGYRTAARVIRLADRLALPLLTLIDTPGAANGAEAERAGAGPAIAEVFAAIAEARVPVTTLVIGEGGSGGALALAAPGRTWVTRDCYFSVIAPELAAAILKRPPEQAPATADQLRLRPQDLVELGVARGIV
ncbi:carboxyl transferase domain-containing protein [Streptomyces lichenis]|uniref:Acetyl-coenzyme A carboxylase carboxyl transferase subunits beta/alpha n=1 Tax=Streptomyces lichenis TaxID=2306967 RepID=A0ABT0I6M8_9ACTN|nr:carboxyl transferase domain-containing protein [Streptomyces lichenis]MCK8676985.1 acetyl-CoA carboxylase [Streptomyces lichenis]